MHIKEGKGKNTKTMTRQVEDFPIHDGLMVSVSKRMKLLVPLTIGSSVVFVFNWMNAKEKIEDEAGDGDGDEGEKE